MSALDEIFDGIDEEWEVIEGATVDAARAELAELRAASMIDIATIAAVLFGDDNTAGQGVREICAEIRRLHERDARQQRAIAEVRQLIEKLAFWGNRYKPTPTRNDSISAIHWLATYPADPEQPAPTDPGDDPCEQCGQPCDGSRCPSESLA